MRVIDLFVLIVLYMAISCIVIYPFFHRVAAIVVLLSGLYFSYKQSGMRKFLIMSFVSCLLALIVYISLLTFVPREFHSEYVSPLKTRTVILEYDHASRPSLYLKHGFFMSKIPLPNFSGATEIISYSVEWISEDQLILKEEINKYSVFIKIKD